MSPRGAAWGALAGAVSARSALTVLASHPPGGAARWARTNHAGRAVTLLEGPAYVVGVVGGVVGGVLAGDVGDAVAVGQLPSREVSAAAAAGVAALGAGALGLLDDLAGDRSSRGLRGHLGALRRGRVTTGAVKVLGLGLTGLVAAMLADRPQQRSGPPGGVPSSVPSAVPPLLHTLVGGAVVAGSANLVNLLDLRPGRALKVVLVAGASIATTGAATIAATAGAAGAAAGAAVACLPGDLAGRTMLGDTGANAAGAVLGCALVQRVGLRGRLAALAVLVALTGASERVSFTAVIERTPVLRELDALGR